MSEASAKPSGRTETCPACGTKGSKVERITLVSLLKPDAATRIGERAYRYCGSPSCDLVYFASDGTTFAKNELTVRVGVKETEPPRSVCYCFNHTIEGIEDEVRETGRSTVLDDIKARMKDGCWCETKSPQGSCCLGTVGRYVKQAQMRFGTGSPSTERQDEHEDCCGPAAATGARPSVKLAERGGLWTAGAVLSAVIASACCWLPLVLIAFGFSALGVSAAFERVRPFFLAAAAVLLSVGFYFVYFRKEACAPGTACAVPNPKLKRFNQVMLWIATAVVVAFAFFPNYVGYLLADNSAAETVEGLPTLTLDIHGMTCEACATHIQQALREVPGVRSASIVYAEGQARVVTDPEAPPSVSALVEAVKKAGYRASVPAGDK